MENRLSGQTRKVRQGLGERHGKGGGGGREFCVGRHSNITLVQLIQFVLGFSLTPISAYRL